MKKLTLKELITLNTYWLGLSFMWNSIHPIVLPAVLLYLVPDTMKNTYLGLLTFGGLALAAIVQPISGAVSDKWQSRWGRRRPLAVFGTLFDFIFLALLARPGSIWTVAIGYIGLQVTSNIAHGPMQGLLPDQVPPEQLGFASGVKNLMDMAGLILASIAAGYLMSPHDPYPTQIMQVVMGVLAISAVITFFSVHEKSSIDKVSTKGGKSVQKFLQLDFHVPLAFLRFIFSRFLFLFGVYGMQTFAHYYIQDVIQVANPVKATGDLMAALAVALVVFASAAGWLTDRLGSRRILIVASILTATGSGLLNFAGDMRALTVCGSLIGAGIGLFLTASWALASGLAPKDQSGKYLGMTNLATAGASAASKLLGIPIDWVNHSFPGKYYGYNILFLMGVVFSLLSLAFLRQHGENSSINSGPVN